MTPETRKRLSMLAKGIAFDMDMLDSIEIPDGRMGEWAQAHEWLRFTRDMLTGMLDADAKEREGRA